MSPAPGCVKAGDRWRAIVVEGGAIWLDAVTWATTEAAAACAAAAVETDAYRGWHGHAVDLDVRPPVVGGRA